MLYISLSSTLVAYCWELYGQVSKTLPWISSFDFHLLTSSGLLLIFPFINLSVTIRSGASCVLLSSMRWYRGTSIYRSMMSVELCACSLCESYTKLSEWVQNGQRDVLGWKGLLSLGHGEVTLDMRLRRKLDVSQLKSKWLAENVKVWKSYESIR